MSKILVIGATNIDIIGKSFSFIQIKDSNVGSVSVSIGGVGKNIAENLKRLGVDIEFITVFGNDEFGKMSMNHLKQINLSFDCSIYSDKNSGTYLAIHNVDGDMELALSDASIIDELQVNHLKKLHSYIDLFEIIVIDTNVNSDVIDYICERYQNKKIVVDAVSTKKSLKLLPNLKYIHTLKCNYIEALSLTQSNSFEEADIIIELLSKGPSQVVITNGEKTIFYNENTNILSSPVDAIREYVNATGAGDAFLSGIIYGYAKKQPISTSIDIAKKIASITLMSPSACSKELDKDWSDTYERLFNHQ